MIIMRLVDVMLMHLCISVVVFFFFVFFFKQKTAYEMRISDWSSDVCSSDLRDAWRAAVLRGRQRRATPDHPELADTHHSGACRSVLAWHGAGAVAGHRASALPCGGLVCHLRRALRLSPDGWRRPEAPCIARRLVSGRGVFRTGDRIDVVLGQGVV